MRVQGEGKELIKRDMGYGGRWKDKRELARTERQRHKRKELEEEEEIRMDKSGEGLCMKQRQKKNYR